MPYRSKAQQRWAHTAAGTKALGGKAKVAEWDAATNFKGLPQRAGGHMNRVDSHLRRVAKKRAAYAGRETPAEERAEMSRTKRAGRLRIRRKGRAGA